jgi:hypothetical protein
MDGEFEKVKCRILEYTSRALDNAFLTYRRNMTRWSKYEDIEKKGLQLVLELGGYIQ